MTILSLSLSFFQVFFSLILLFKERKNNNNNDSKKDFVVVVFVKISFLKNYLDNHLEDQKSFWFLF